MSVAPKFLGRVAISLSFGDAKKVTIVSIAEILLKEDS